MSQKEKLILAGNFTSYIIELTKKLQLECIGDQSYQKWIVTAIRLFLATRWTILPSHETLTINPVDMRFVGGGLGLLYVEGV